MDTGTDAREFDVGKIIEQVKGDPNGPEARARKVYEHLAKSDFTTWDVLCFCVEYIGNMTSVLTWLMEPARSLVRLVYLAHYIRFEGVAWLDKKISASDSQTE